MGSSYARDLHHCLYSALPHLSSVLPIRVTLEEIKNIKDSTQKKKTAKRDKKEHREETIEHEHWCVSLRQDRSHNPTLSHPLPIISAEEVVLMLQRVQHSKFKKKQDTNLGSEPTISQQTKFGANHRP